MILHVAFVKALSVVRTKIEREYQINELSSFATYLFLQ